MLFVPVGVRFQEAASHKPIDEQPLFQSVGLGDRGWGRVGESQQQGADLGAGEFPVRQCGGDRVERPAFALAVEREAIELGEFAVEFVSTAPRPGAFRVARQQRDAPDPQSVCVAFNRAGAQPEVARERQAAHLGVPRPSEIQENIKRTRWQVLCHAPPATPHRACRVAMAIGPILGLVGGEL
jgi:hypothetical protein